MNKPMRLSLGCKKAPLRLPRYAGTPPLNPVYPALLLLVAIIGAASLLAFWRNDRLLETRAARGEPEAQYLLGKAYFDDANSPQDYARAARLIRKAAEHGYVRAQTGLGMLYEHGLGVPQSYDRALTWLRRAADQGYPVAQNELGIMYAKGHGVRRDLDQAAHWCRLAATQGSDVAQHNFEIAQLANARIIPALIASETRSYQRVVLQKVEADGITVSFSPKTGGLGLAKLRLENLPADLQDLCKYAAQASPRPNSAYSQVGAISRVL